MQRISRTRQHNSKPPGNSAARRTGGQRRGDYRSKHRLMTGRGAGEQGTDMGSRGGTTGVPRDIISSYLPHDFLLLLCSIEGSERYIITTTTLPVYKRAEPRKCKSGLIGEETDESKKDWLCKKLLTSLLMNRSSTQEGLLVMLEKTVLF